MTTEEFEMFKSRLFAEYPSLYGWLKHNAPTPSDTLGYWYRLLKRYTLAECEAVLDRWQTTNDSPFDRQSKDHAPYIIRAVIEKQRSVDGKEQDHQRERRSQTANRQQQVSPMAPIFTKAIEKQGAEDETIRQWCSAELDKAVLEQPYDGPRYRCAVCCDRGVVVVWRRDVLNRLRSGAIKRGDVIKEKYRAYTMACSCEAGEHHRREDCKWNGNKTKPLPTYDPERDCQYDSGRRWEVELEKLMQWVSEHPKDLAYPEFGTLN